MIKGWIELSREEVFKKYSWLIQKRVYRLPSEEEADYYIRTAGAGACVLAVTENNKVITVKQYRPGPDKIYNELPGGFVEINEDPIKAGMRELKEETGYTGEVVWSGKWQNDAYTQQDRHILVAINCKKVSEPKLDSTEFAELELLSVKDFIKQARSGELTDTAGAMLGLDHLGLLK
jgi:ADP-ribose pyrophosphatase